MMGAEITIVGGGPAGMATALQLQRYGLFPTLFEESRLGGLLNNANLIENYPGYPGGISGREFVGLFRRQLEQVGVRVVYQTVNRIQQTSSGFEIESDGQLKQTRFLVLATGTKPVRLPDDIVPDKCKVLVNYEVVSVRDLRDRRIAIIGAGDAAFDYALQMGRYNDVFIYNRSSRTKALSSLVSRVDQHPHIHYKSDINLTGIERTPADILSLTWSSSSGEENVEVDRLLCAIGRTPNLDCLGRELLAEDETIRELDGLYVIGDVKNKLHRQCTIAIGQGIHAAMSIWDALGNRE